MNIEKYKMFVDKIALANLTKPTAIRAALFLLGCQDKKKSLVTMQDIANNLNVDRSMVAKAIKDLNDNGFIKVCKHGRVNTYEVIV